MVSKSLKETLKLEALAKYWALAKQTVCNSELPISSEMHTGYRLPNTGPNTSLCTTQVVRIHRKHDGVVKKWTINVPNLQQSPRPNKWRPAELFNRLNAAKELKQWLLETGSLTAKIRQTCPQMRVKILAEGWQRPLVQECQQLKLSLNEQAWVRCVVLMCDHQPLVYARTIIPRCHAGNHWFALKKLGDRPLGEILFQPKQAHRTPFILSQQPIEHWPYLKSALPDHADQLNISYARQSLFRQHGDTLLLTEAFI